MEALHSRQAHPRLSQVAQVKRFIRHLLGRLGYRIQGTRYTPRQLLDPRCSRVLDLGDVIARLMLERGHELTFIQVGAFDGITADPLHRYISRYGWRGVMVEPQPRAAAQLRELYKGNDRIRIIQAALDQQCGTRTLFTVESQSAPVWAEGMASFRREHITKHEYLIPGLPEMIREIAVDCIPFEDVFAQLDLPRVDLLQIDAEGADEFLLSLFPFDRVKPAIIHWEIKNVSVTEREACLERLSALGYRFASSGDEDMIATL